LKPEGLNNADNHHAITAYSEMANLHSTDGPEESLGYLLEAEKQETKAVCNGGACNSDIAQAEAERLVGFSPLRP
jgi:hypothetical protein